MSEWFGLILLSAATKQGFWATSLGRVVLAILPALVTALLTAALTVASVYISLHDDVLTLKQTVLQIQVEHRSFVQEQREQDARLVGVEKAVSHITGALEAGKRP